MKKIFIIHGFMGAPNGGWRPWLMAELYKKDIYACALPMPNPNEPQVKDWVACMNDAISEPNEEIFLVGHSLGSPAILRYLESLSENSKIGGVILVSSPYKILHPENKESKTRKIDNFLDTDFDFEKIKSSSNNFHIIHGSNDDRVPIEHAEFLSKSIGCELTVIPNGGHLNEHYGFYELPEVLEILQKMMV